MSGVHLNNIVDNRILCYVPVRALLGAHDEVFKAEGFGSAVQGSNCGNLDPRRKAPLNWVHLLHVVVEY